MPETLQSLIQKLAIARSRAELRLPFMDAAGELFNVQHWGISLCNQEGKLETRPLAQRTLKVKGRKGNLAKGAHGDSSDFICWMFITASVVSSFLSPCPRAPFALTPSPFPDFCKKSTVDLKGLPDSYRLQN